MAKERYIKCYGNRFYIKEIKRSWWRKWEIEKTGGIVPNLYERLPGGAYDLFINEDMF